MNIQIMRMNFKHIESVAQIEKSFFSYPWNEEALKSECNNPLSIWLTACDGEKVVGYIGSQSVLGESDMMNLAVIPEYQRKGIGHSLLEHLLYELRNDNHCLTLEVRASNNGAIALYEGMGFFQVGRRPNYYQRPTEDAVILRKEW